MTSVINIQLLKNNRDSKMKYSAKSVKIYTLWKQNKNNSTIMNNKTQSLSFKKCFNSISKRKMFLIN